MGLLGTLGLAFQIGPDEAEFLAGEDFRGIYGGGTMGDHERLGGWIGTPNWVGAASILTSEWEQNSSDEQSIVPSGVTPVTVKETIAAGSKTDSIIVPALGSVHSTIGDWDFAIRMSTHGRLKPYLPLRWNHLKTRSRSQRMVQS